MHRDDVQFLRDHDPPDDGIDEQGEEHIPQEDENPHQNPDEELLGFIHHLLVQAHSSGDEPHSSFA